MMSSGTRFARGDGWKAYDAYFTVPEGVDTVYVRLVGHGYTDFCVDDVQVEPGIPPPLVKRSKVKGWAKERPVEPMDRGVVAVETPGGVYVGWRLLKDDPAAIASAQNDFDARLRAKPALMEQTRRALDLLEDAVRRAFRPAR